MRRAALILLFLAVLWALDAAMGTGVFWAHDLRHHHMPWRTWAVGEWLSGRVPLWAPEVASGFPLMADGQTGVFYLPAMLLWALLPDAVALNWSIMLHFWWAGLGMFWLLRSLNRSPLAALFGAIGFAFSGFLATHSLYLGMLHAASWLPWLLGGVVRKWHGLAGLAAFMMMVAGHPQGAAFGMLLAGGLAVYQAVKARRLPLGFAGGMLLAILAASPQLVATLELASFSMRDGGVSQMFANIGSLPPQELINSVLPRFFGFDRPGDVPQTYYHRGDGYWGAGENHWEMSFYLGIPVALLALWRARQERFWLVVVLASVLLMLGGSTPAWPILRHLPGLSGFRFPVRFALLLTVAMSILASGGLDDIREASTEKLRRWSLMVGGLSAVFVLMMGLVRVGLDLGEGAVRGKLTGHFMAQTMLPPPPVELSPLESAALPSPEPEDPDAIPEKVDRIVASLKASTTPLSSEVWGPAMILAILAGGMALASRERITTQRLASVAVGLLYIDLFSFGANYQVRYPRSFVEQQPVALTVIAEDKGRFRTTVVDRRQDPALDVELMSASLGLLYGQRDVILTSPLLMLRNDALLGLAGLDVGDKGPQKIERLLAHPEIVDLLGLRWLLTVHEIDDQRYEQRIAGPVNLYRNPSAMPGAFLVGCASQPTAVWEAMLDLDPRQAAIVEGGEPGVPDCVDGAGAGTAEIVSDSPQHMVITTTSDAPALLVQTDSYYPGWEATIDGEPAALLRADLLFRGIPVPAGEHTVELRYRPSMIRAALLVAPFGLLGLLGLLITRRPEAL